MKILINPPKPKGVLIVGFIYNKKRLDLPPGEKSNILEDDFANEALKTFKFLDKEESVSFSSIRADTKKSEESEELGELGELGETDLFLNKETPLKGLKGLSKNLLEELKKYEIVTREQFFRLIEKDPEYIKKIIGIKKFNKFSLK